MRAARALSFWQSRGDDWAADFTKLPFNTAMYYLHFYQGANKSKNWERAKTGVLAFRLTKIFEVDRELAARIFWSLPEHDSLPQQIPVLSKLAGNTHLQASLLTARGITMGHRLVGDMIWDNGVNWMKAARFLNTDGLSAEEQKILGEIKRRYLHYFGEDFTFKLKYSMNWYNRLDPVLRLENMIMEREILSGKRSAEGKGELQSKWSQLMPLLRSADPKSFVHALEGFSELEQNVLFARMIEFGGIERVKKVLILVLNDQFALDNPDVAATGTESADLLRSRLHDILNLIDDQPLRKQSRRLVTVFRDYLNEGGADPRSRFIR